MPVRVQDFLHSSLNYSTVFMTRVFIFNKYLDILTINKVKQNNVCMEAYPINKRHVCIYIYSSLFSGNISKITLPLENALKKTYSVAMQTIIFSQNY